ncbi:hypothetical protein C8_263 [Cannes 8 virus]|nr:hypothetical protein C8_263 [Cannes 8 virus]
MFPISVSISLEELIPLPDELIFENAKFISFEFSFISAIKKCIPHAFCFSLTFSVKNFFSVAGVSESDKNPNHFKDPFSIPHFSNANKVPDKNFFSLKELLSFSSDEKSFCFSFKVKKSIQNPLSITCDENAFAFHFKDSKFDAEWNAFACLSFTDEKSVSEPFTDSFTFSFEDCDPKCLAEPLSIADDVHLSFLHSEHFRFTLFFSFPFSLPNTIDEHFPFSDSFSLWNVSTRFFGEILCERKLSDHWQ